MKQRFFYLILFLCSLQWAVAENGYDLWLRYHKIDNSQLLKRYKQQIACFNLEGSSPTLQEAKNELEQGMSGLLGEAVPQRNSLCDGMLLVGTPASSSLIASLGLDKEIEALGDEGYLIKSLEKDKKAITVIAASKDIGAMYGVFHFLRLLQTHAPLQNLDIVEVPKLKVRMLNHWDNMNGTIERGYAGYTLWDWQRLPGYIDPRYRDYARANASIGVNGTVLNNVNASSKILDTQYIVKVAALASALRPYGIKVYLSARFSAPKELGATKTADPLAPDVRAWWKKKVDEIYKYIPDFGGFLVKANSEGQPGPQDYGRTHADGANMLGEALKPHGGIVLWRAFVYQNNRTVDRIAGGYNEFKPLNGKFVDNVLVQVKNGPNDFQPREPFHPLFGSMPNTPLALEVQITQEYLGYSSYLAYLGPLYEECLDSDTDGKGTTVADVLVDYNTTHRLSCMAGVSNIGTDINWCGHLFGQSNWYVFGRMAWNPSLSSEEVADEWLRMTFTNDASFIDPVKKLMMESREYVVEAHTPLGLNHIMCFFSHYGPGPWFKGWGWDAKDYHKADETGIGVDRTATGTKSAFQYKKPVSDIFANPKTCPDKFLLWFHHLPWDYKMRSGQTLWNELCEYYYRGVDHVHQMREVWNSIEGKIDAQRFQHVKQLLKVQEDETTWWRDACLLYFQTFSKRPIPAKYEQPKHSLEYYKKIPYPYDWKGVFE